MELGTCGGLHVTRRWLASRALAVLLAAGVSHPLAEDDVRTALRRAFARPRSARTVGSAVLRNCRSQIAFHDVLADFRSHLPEIYRMCGLVPRDRLARMLRAASRDDFADGRVLNVNGWILSRTEALTCAVIASA